MPPEPLASPAALRAHARAELQKYADHFAAEASGLQAIADLLADTSADPFSRGHMQGHITTSGLVYDAAADKVLLIHHRTLDRWLPPVRWRKRRAFTYAGPKPKGALRC